MPEAFLPHSSPEGTFNVDFRGVHYDLLKNRVPRWFMQASTPRQQALADSPLHLPAWYSAATPAARAALADLHERYRTGLNNLDASLGRIDDIAAFAEQRLKAAIKQQFNLDLDVKRVYFARKYGLKGRDDLGGAFVFDQQSDSALTYLYRGMSLLEAALANFDADEEAPLSCSDCQIITRFDGYDGDAIPTFAALQQQAVPLTPHGFAQLCRKLDLGTLYQAHLKAVLQPDDVAQRTQIELQFEQHQRAQFALSLEVAKLQFASDLAMGKVLQQLLVDPAQSFLDGRPVTFAALKVFDSVLVGPLLIGPVRQRSGQVERVVVYVPDDPQHSLKVYASSGEFMAELRRRLHSASYRRFFSRFVPVREQGEFFRRFNTLFQPPGTDAASDYPLRSNLPRLPLDEQAITGNLWEQVRLAHVRKTFADARAIAVPTGDEDRRARFARLASYLDTVVNVLNLAVFMVPVLGPLMMTVGAAQMMNDVFEGIEAYEQDEIKEMWAHLASVALNTAFVATGAKVLPAIQKTHSVAHLKQVSLPSAQEVLWSPDLEPYELSGWEPRTQPDEHGLYSHNGETTLALEGRYYRVQPAADGEHYRIQHPQRPHAYQPWVRHNGRGAWLHEADQPQSWSGVRLMRRLGTAMDSFSDVQLEHIRQVSGISEDRLRRVHVDSEPTPAILLDTARQFRAYNDAVEVSEQIRAGRLSDALFGYAAVLMTELPGWPVGKGIEVQGSVEGELMRYGESVAMDGVVRIRRDELMQGRLPERVVDSLTEEQLKGLLGQHPPSGTPLRAQALTRQLEAHAIKHRVRLFRSIYSDRTLPDNPAVRLVQRDFQRLPTLMVQELLDAASPRQLSEMTRRQRVPLALAEDARELQAQLRLGHAYEGLYLQALDNPDTESLVLNTLENLPGWHDDIRLEVRDGEFNGQLRAAFGPVGASSCKVLARVEDGRYQAFDEHGQQLHGINGLYGALQHALTDAHRNAIGLPHVGQGEELERLIAEKALPRHQLREVLRMQPRKRPSWRMPQRLADNRLGYPLSGRGQGRHGNIRERVRMLYPAITDVQLAEYLRIQDLSTDTWLRVLEREFEHLDRTMNRWLVEGPGDPPTLKIRRKIRDTVRLAWQKRGEWDVDTVDRYRGQRITLKGSRVGAQLATLPPLPGNFDHVSSVHLPGCGVTDLSNGFLSTFRRLRILNLERNALTRLPDVCADMPQLEGLDLSENQIVLTPETALHIRGMHRLIWLALEGNPLGMTVDVGRMPQLKWLYLANSGVQGWPAGIFGAPRPRDFVLDLTSNTLTAIPDVAPGSDRARILARTVVTQELLTPEVGETLKLYIESVGMDPDRRFPPRGAQDSAHWMSGMTRQQWIDKQGVWSDLEEAPGSEPFFDEIRKLGENLDRRTADYKVDVTAKVWRMLDAMVSDTELREHLFEMALAPTTCVDAGAQLFNAMGIEVLLTEAKSLTDPDLARLELLELAKGKARLDELGRIARARVSELHASGRPFPAYDSEGDLIQQSDAEGNPVVSIDEVEIHLAYVTRLADRLDLPWQSAMFYREPDVTQTMIDDAYTRVVDLERGDLLREGIVEQPFWVDYVEASYASEFEAVSAKNDALIDLYAAQQELADDGRLSAQKKADLRVTINNAAQVLGKLPSQTDLEQVMSDEEYFADSASLGEERKDVLRRVTDRIMGREPQNRK